MTPDPKPLEVASLNLARRAYRRLFLRLLLIVVLGLPAVFALSWLGDTLAPPYGLRILGWDLAEWALIALVVLLIAEFYWKSRQISRALSDPGISSLPVVTVLSGITVIAQRATVMGMEWSGFFGPLRPVRRR